MHAGKVSGLVGEAHARGIALVCVAICVQTHPEWVIFYILLQGLNLESLLALVEHIGVWRLGIFWRSALAEKLIGLMRLRGTARVVVWQRRMQMSSGKPCVSCPGEQRPKGILLLHVCTYLLE